MLHGHSEIKWHAAHKKLLLNAKLQLHRSSTEALFLLENNQTSPMIILQETSIGSDHTSSWSRGEEEFIGPW